MLEDAGSQYELAELIGPLAPQKNGTFLSKMVHLQSQSRRLKKINETIVSYWKEAQCHY